MKTKVESFMLLVFTVIFLIPFQIRAQSSRETAASINKIATISEGKIGEFKKLTSLAQLKRSNQDNWLDVKKNDDLYFNDILKLNKDIWLRIEFKNRSQNGAISLFPDNLKDPGEYQFLEDRESSRTVALALDIRSGSAILEVAKNKVNTTITGNLKTEVKSGSVTRALFNVRADGTGEIFLQQGHLTFPGNTEFPGLKQGQIANFQNGQITSVIVPTVPMAAQYKDLIKFNNSKVFKKPFFKKPGTWIGLAVIGAGAAAAILKPWEQKEVIGTIRVNWGSN